ncbi:MAG: hypothetical protein U0930_19860 [Pirellulales bacterium]
MFDLQTIIVLTIVTACGTVLTIRFVRWISGSTMGGCGNCSAKTRFKSTGSGCSGNRSADVTIKPLMQIQFPATGSNKET